MKVELTYITPDAANVIGLAAAICYDAKTDRESNIKRAAHCRDSGHLATMRFAQATFHVSGMSRVCSHQIVRMAHAGILQKSQRYVKETSVEYIDPPTLALVESSDQLAWVTLQREAEALYLKLVYSGQMKKEDARYILPQGCSTEMNLCLNFQAWKDFLKNRNSKHAQWEVRNIAVEIQAQLAAHCPEIFGAKA